MADYTKTTDFAAKDALASGQAAKVIVGTEFDDEFNNIATAIATKYDSTDRGAVSGICGLDTGGLVDPTDLPAATATAQGAVELATSAETITGTDTGRAVTPAGLQAVLDQNGGMGDDLVNLADPNADRILFWDDSASALTTLTVGTGLAITTTTIATSDSGIVHDSLSGFVANEHIDHTAVTLTAGEGLSGGGDISASRSFAVDLTELTAATVTEAVDLDADTIVGIDSSAGAQRKFSAQGLLTPEQGTAFSTATDTVAADDFGKVIPVTYTAACTVTLPNGLKSGFWCTLLLTGSGGSIVLSATTTLNTKLSLTTCSNRYGAVTVYHGGSNVWYAWGDLDS